ncbi:MAG: HAD-IA family hydrolase [Kiritimatiellae bacterium]|nr:HAD-IA family hydrolase [Kiritimatiellia bacterium]
MSRPSVRPALLFDLDGTLLSSEGDLAIAVNLMRARHALPPLSLPTVVSYVGDGLSKLAERSLQGAPVPLDTALAELSAFYADHLTDTTHPLPGVDDGLRALHDAGFPLALVTNKPSPHARRLLDHFSWTPLFSAVVAGGDTPFRKPRPEPLLHALSLLGRPPSSAWMIGDHHTDLAAARLAAVPSIFLSNGLGTAAPETPTATLPTFSALLTFLLSAPPSA